jgi:hypothetical protein
VKPEGNACPWYSRPGWNGAHCGIFGQFQSGVSSGSACATCWRRQSRNMVIRAASR